MFYVEAADVPGEGAELHFFFFAWNYLAGPPFLVFPLQHKRLSGSARLGATALVLSLLAYGQGRLDSVYIKAFDPYMVLAVLWPRRPPGLASVRTALAARDET